MKAGKELLRLDELLEATEMADAQMVMTCKNWLLLIMLVTLVFGFLMCYSVRSCRHSKVKKVWITPYGFSQTHRYHTDRNCSYLSNSKGLPDFEQCVKCAQRSSLAD